MLLLAPLLLLRAGVASAGSAPGTGIAGTPHDFSAKGGGVGLCTFCHTPHRAIGTRLLWNHTLSAATYTWQDVTTTMGGTQLPSITQSWTGPSKYCLSCHDGSVAIGDVNWWREGKPSPLDNNKHAWPDAFNVGATNNVLGNMSGNHPVAIPYPYLNVKNTYNGVTTGDAVILPEWVPDPSVNLIRLFNNPSGNLVSAGVSAGKTGVECSSCHDPHNGTTVQDDLFLRGKLTGSTGGTSGYICLKCHSK